MATKDANTTVYVGGFSPDTNAALLHSAFIPFGDILDISLPSDPARKGSHKGFAFITFASTEAALDACDNMHRNCLPTATNRGRVLKVNKAKPPKGAGTQNSNKPIWASEEWIAEHGTHGVGEPSAGAPGGDGDASLQEA
ncbi:hypothetical protein JCM3774_000494 [Rhodotorula dairenensis]